MDVLKINDDDDDDTRRIKLVQILFYFGKILWVQTLFYYGKILLIQSFNFVWYLLEKIANEFNNVDILIKECVMQDDGIHHRCSERSKRSL